MLVGTAHVSEKSVREVEEAIEAYRPDVVAVELDARRYHTLKEGGQENKEIPVKELLKGNNLAIFLMQTLLAFVQRKVGAEMGVKPGSEMLAAIDAAKTRGLSIALIDRDLGITLARFWARMSLREKFRMFYSLVLASLGIGTSDVDIDQITQEDVVSSLIEELREFTPSVAEVLVDERDAYLAHNLLEIGKTKRVIGVVGAGHREGIRKYLEHPETIPPIGSISNVPRRRSIPWLKIFSALVVLQSSSYSCCSSFPAYRLSSCSSRSSCCSWCRAPCRRFSSPPWAATGSRSRPRSAWPGTRSSTPCWPSAGSPASSRPPSIRRPWMT